MSFVCARVRKVALGTVILFAVGLLPMPAGAAVLGGAADVTLKREPQVAPKELGGQSLPWLQYADPAEGIDLIDPPEANNQGSAQLELPLGIPKGRGGVQPDLTLRYDSSGASSWLGLGWDLNLGEITVDTEFGVPRYNAGKETDTYLLDGDRLSPTAITSDPGPRVANRADFTRQVDDDFALIIRHGTSPKNYWWEVRSKLGGIKWYGGFPDRGGPTGGLPLADGTQVAGEGRRDPSAILTDGEGNAYRWGLSAERDVGVNMMRYFYEQVGNQPPEGVGKQLYLSRVQYTATSDVGGRPSDPLEDPAYEVRFLRDAAAGATSKRKDVVVSGRGGFVESTADLLRRVEVNYGGPEQCTVGDPTTPNGRCVSPRTYNRLAKQFDFHYDLDGPFGKALLTSVDQLGSDEQVYATNRFDYYDDVRAGGSYNGFTSARWDSPPQGIDQQILGATMGASALGSSRALTVDAHAYLGFAPFHPRKSQSAGGSITINGGVTEATAELLDINGDQLLDQVWREGGNIRFRLNRGGPDGSQKFDDQAGSVAGLSTLSSEWNIGVGAAVEAHVEVSVQFSIAADVAVGETYFTDVNNDGLPDLVQAGRVQFNRLDANGIPRFSDDSAGTRVPIDSRQLQLPRIDKLQEIEAQQRAQSPLQDTVRRWLAPYDGTIVIAAPVTLDPQVDMLDPTAPYRGDGVRTTIETRGSVLWAERLLTPGQVATPTGVGAVAVTKGQAVYFRLQSIDDGRRDQVKWDPVIQYTGRGEQLDVNGLDYWKYTASRDFTLGGRAGISTAMPLDGRVVVGGVVRKPRATTDDVTVVAVLRKQDNSLVTFPGQRIPAAFVGDTPVDIQLDVKGPDADKFDAVAIKLAVDTPIDVGGLSWTSNDGLDGPPMYYTSATTAGGQPVQTQVDGKFVIQLHPRYDIDTYGANDQPGPQPAQVLFADNGNADRSETRPVSGITGRFLAPGQIDRALLPATVVFSVKNRGGFACKGTMTIPKSPPPTAGTSDPPPLFSNKVECPRFTAREGEPYWFDFSTLDPRLSTAGLVFTGDGFDEDDAAFHWQHLPADIDSADVFPAAYRGWGFAGYNGDGVRATAPIDAGAFRIDRNNFPNPDNLGDRPDSFDDARPEKNSGYKNPAQGRAFLYIPFFLQSRDLRSSDLTSDKVTSMEPVWRGLKDNTVGAAGFVRASRTAADDPDISRVIGVGDGGETVSAVRRVGVTGPTLSAAGGLGIVGGSVTLAQSFGLLDYFDMNGDSFPDVIAPGYVKYTGPRGGYQDEPRGSVEPSQDLTVAIGVGFEGSAGKINANSQGDTSKSGGAQQDSTGGKSKRSSSSAAKGDDGTTEDFGYSVGASAGIDLSFTNPVIDGSGGFADAAEAIEKINVLPNDIERLLTDVNGDGLPDRVAVRPSGIWVKLNLGYDFAPEVRWAGGGVETGTSVSASAGLGIGFQIFNKGYSGGLGYNENVDYPIYSWADINGDGILDRLRRDGTEIRVAFGTGAGIGGEVDYGNFQDGSIQLVAGLGIPTGEQAGMDQTRGLGVGFDATIPIGPFCPIFLGCWIIVNPGVHVATSFSATRVTVADINGDGYADSLAARAGAVDNSNVDVQLNRHGRTNLLKSVRNPLGGTMRLDYARAGNTVEQPNPLWDLAMVEVDDGRPGDGVDKQLTTYEYRDNRYSPLEREVLGYATVIERQRVAGSDTNPFDDPVLRFTERTYRNQTIFDRGLLTSETLKAPDGRPLKETRSEWKLVEVRDLASGTPADLGNRPDDPAGTRFFAISVARERTKVEQRWYEGNGNLGQQTWTTYEYDDLGNVGRQVDVGEPEDPNDDVTAITTWSSCEDSSSSGPGGLKEPFPCPAPVPAGRVSPLWTPSRCPTWTSIPATFQVLDAAGKVMRERNGAPALCDNSSVTRLEEKLADGTFALTELDYDEWGSYNHIVYPPNADGERVRIDYIYDDEAGHANVATTIRTVCMTATEPDPEKDPCAAPLPEQGTPAWDALEKSVATFDSLSGRIASRTDANEQTTSYRYDKFGRIAGVDQDGGNRNRLAFEYGPTNGATYAWARARHDDVFRPGDTIDTISFVDGLGRETRTKKDATVYRTAPDAGPGAGTATDVRVVSGAIEFDDLGRVVSERYPAVEELSANPVAFGTAMAVPPPRKTAFDLLDRPTRVTFPDTTFEQTTYGFGGQADFGRQLFMTTSNDRNGKPEVRYRDVRQNLIGHDDAPAGKPPIRTRYAYDGLGQLVQVVDNGGSTTTHGYDQFGRRTSTNTPDGGLLERQWDPASNLAVEIDPNMRANGARTTYQYEADRLTRIDYPPGTPDVSYTWGGPAARGTANGNGMARIIGVLDGGRDQRLAYDRHGNVVRDTATMLVHNLNDSTRPGLTYSTQFEYDTWGRMRSLVYPDGQTMAYGYDSGGLMKSLSGQKGSRTYGYVDRMEYDEFGARRLQKTANGVVTESTFDALTRRLARQQAVTPAREVQDLRYTYDNVGNVLKQENQLPPAVGGLKGAPSVQEYTYDPYYRLASATGSSDVAPKKTRAYTFSNSYDQHGNLKAKSQKDVLEKTTQKPTTYDLEPTYRSDKPHQIAKIGSLNYTYDPNGNHTGWFDDKTGNRRTVTWDATDRVRSVADQGSTTTYAYDESGRLAIERGPGGEKAFVNPWYTVANGSVAWKHIWAGEERVASQRALDDGEYELFRYFLHTDFQGGVNLVTDDTGLVFQHFEYFPSGEQWVVEQGTDNRTPYGFAGAYYDEVRKLLDLGARWYSPREQFLYSTDPVLQDEPDEVIGDPRLLPAYAYATSNPVRLVDRDGRRPEEARKLLAEFGRQLREQQAPEQGLQKSIPQLAAVLDAGPFEPVVAGTDSAVDPGAVEERREKQSAFQRIRSNLDPPLVELNLLRTEDGLKFQNVKILGKKVALKKRKP